MELAASWKPLAKSNANAMITTMATRIEGVFTVRPAPFGRGRALENGSLSGQECLIATLWTIRAVFSTALIAFSMRSMTFVQRSTSSASYFPE
jgi:hypothetical protein